MEVLVEVTKIVPDKSSPGSVDFRGLDAFIGYVSRRAEEIGFLYWSFYVTKDTEGRLALAMDLCVETDSGIVSGLTAFYFGEDVAWDMVSPRLHTAMFSINEKMKQKGLTLLPSHRKQIRDDWEASCSFAPQFFVKGEGGPRMFTMNSDSCLIEIVDDVTGRQCAIRPEYIQSMCRMPKNGFTKIHTDTGFLLAREPDYFALVDHWRDLMQDKVKATGTEIVRVP